MANSQNNRGGGNRGGGNRGNGSRGGGQQQQRQQQQRPKGDRPTVVFRDGDLKLSCWKNDGNYGHWYSCKLRRIYKKDDNWEETDAINSTDFLRAASLFQLAHNQLQMADGKIKIEFLDGENGGGGDNGDSSDAGDGDDVDNVPY